MTVRSAVLTFVVVILTAASAIASNNAWMYGNQPSTTNYVPDPTHSFNPVAPGTITVHRAAQGVYQITFKNLVMVTGNDANVQVTPYGNGIANCHIQGWGTVPGPDFNAFVRCYNTTNGQNIDSEYSLLITYH